MMAPKKCKKKKYGTEEVQQSIKAFKPSTEKLVTVTSAQGSEPSDPGAG